MSFEEILDIGTFDSIKPCPCCGGEALLTFGYTQYKDELVFIKCQSASCGLQTEAAYIETESADNVKNALIKEQIARWNRRSLK